VEETCKQFKDSEKSENEIKSNDTIFSNENEEGFHNESQYEERKRTYTEVVTGKLMNKFVDK
jgi:hypothetical protein